MSVDLAEKYTGVAFTWLFGKPDSLWRVDRISSRTERVIICEGETAAMALMNAGADDGVANIVVATPSASTWRDEWGGDLAGRRITLWPDADEAGEKQAERIYQSLQGVAASIEIVAHRMEAA